MILLIFHISFLFRVILIPAVNIPFSFQKFPQELIHSLVDQVHYYLNYVQFYYFQDHVLVVKFKHFVLAYHEFAKLHDFS